VELSVPLEKPATRIRELVAGESLAISGPRLDLRTEVRAQSVLVYRVDF